MELKYFPGLRSTWEDLNRCYSGSSWWARHHGARVLMKKAGIIPWHSHHNEQFTYVLEGALKFWIDGKEIVVNAGEVLTIPPHMPQGGSLW